MSETPRTDALPRIRQAGSTEYIPIEDCRQLERELAEMTQRRDDLLASLEKVVKYLTISPPASGE